MSEGTRRTREAVLHDYLEARDGRPPARLDVLSTREAEVMRANDGLVRMVAAKYRTRGRDPDLFDDLVQEGRIGLLASIRLYQDDGRATLATFAFFRIRERIARWACEQSTPLRISATTQRDARRRDESVGSAKPSLPRAVWLSAMHDGNGPPFDLRCGAPGPEALLVSREARLALATAVSALPARERALLVRNLGLDGGPRTSQADLAADLGVSRQRVHQILAATVRRLRARPEVAALHPDGQSALDDWRRSWQADERDRRT